MRLAKTLVLLFILPLLVDDLPSWGQVTLWETYQSAGQQAIQDRRVNDAERLLLAAAKHIEIVNPEDPRLADTLNDLGVLYGMQNRDIEAEPLFQRALVINEKAYGRQHPSIVLTLQNLAVIYASQDKFSEAHVAALESLEISRRLFGTNHPRIGSSCRTLAIVYALQGDAQTAERFAERSIVIFEQTLGERHPETIASLEMMARLMWTAHRDQEAEKLETRLNSIRQSPTSGSELTHDADPHGGRNRLSE